MLIALANQAIDGIVPYVLDAAKAEAYGITLHGEAALRIVNIWAQYLNIMLLASINVVRQFLHILHEARHGSGHEFREIVGLQIRRLVRDVRIGRTMGFIKAIASEVYEQVEYFVCNRLGNTVRYGALNKGLALRF